MPARAFTELRYGAHPPHSRPALPAPAGLPLPRRRPRRGPFPSPPAPAGRPVPARRGRRTGAGRGNPLRGTAGLLDAAHPAGPDHPEDGDKERTGQRREKLGYLDPLPVPPPLRHVVPVCSAGDVRRRRRRQPRERRRENRAPSARLASPQPPRRAVPVSEGEPERSIPAAGLRSGGQPRWAEAGLGTPRTTTSGCRGPPVAVWLIRNSPRGRCGLSCSRGRASPRGARVPPSKVQLPNRYRGLFAARFPRRQAGLRVGAYPGQEAAIQLRPGRAVRWLDEAGVPVSARRCLLVSEELAWPAGIKVLQLFGSKKIDV